MRGVGRHVYAFILALSSASLLPARAQQAPPAAGSEPSTSRGFEHVMPDEVLAFVGVADAQAFGRSLEACPWGRLLADPECADLRAALEQRLGEVFEEEAWERGGLDTRRAGAGLQGALACALRVRGPFPERGQESSRLAGLGLSFLFAAGLAPDHAAIDAYLTNFEFNSGKNKGTSIDVSNVGRWRVTDYGYGWEKGPDNFRTAIAADRLVCEVSAPGIDLMRPVLSRLDGELDGGSLGGSPRFAGSLAARPGGLQLWLDFQPLRSFVEPYLEIPPGPAYARARRVRDFVLRSGLLDIEDLSGNIEATPDGVTLEARLRWPAGGSLHDALGCLWAPGPFGQLAAVPPDAVQVIGWRLDPTRVFDLTVEELLAAGVPPAQVTSWLAGFEESTGISLRDDLLESLTGELTCFAADVDREEAFPGTSRETPTSFALLIGLKDEAAFSALLEQVARHRGWRATREQVEYRGHEVSHLPLLELPGFSLAVNYAVLPGMLVLSPSTTLTLRTLQCCPPGASEAAAPVAVRGFAQRVDVAAALDRLQPNGGLVCFHDTPKLVHRAVAAMMGRSSPGSKVPPASVFESYLAGVSVVSLAADEGGLWIRRHGP